MTQFENRQEAKKVLEKLGVLEILKHAIDLELVESAEDARANYADPSELLEAVLDEMFPAQETDPWAEIFASEEIPPADPEPRIDWADDPKGLIAQLKDLKNQAFFNSPWPDSLDRLVGLLPEAARRPTQEFMRRISPKEFLAMMIGYLVFRQVLWDEEVPAPEKVESKGSAKPAPKAEEQPAPKKGRGLFTNK